MKQINESQKSSKGDLNPIVSRHSYKRQKESDTILQKQEEIKLILVQKQEMLREKVKVCDRFHGTEQKNRGKDEVFMRTQISQNDFFEVFTPILH